MNYGIYLVWYCNQVWQVVCSTGMVHFQKIAVNWLLKQVETIISFETARFLDILKKEKFISAM